MENAGTVRYVITADNERFMEQLAAAGKALLAFAGQIDEVDSQVNNLGSRQTLQSANNFTSSISQTAKELGQFTTALGRVGWNSFTTAAGIASGTLIKFASGAVTDTQFLENTQIQMQGLTHSIEDGNKAMAMATQYFKNNPFNRFDVTDATKQLIQYGAALDDIPTLLDKMGKVSLSTGVEINTLSRIYQSAMSNGRISTGDINLLAERGIPIWKALGDVTGKTNAEIRSDLEKGKLAIEDFQKAFDLLVDDNAMEQFNNTFSRQLDRFKGRLSNMRAAIAGYTMDYEKGLQVDPSGLYKTVTEVLKVFANTFDNGVGKQFLESLTKLGNGLAWVIEKLMGFYEITVKSADGTEKVVKMSKTLDVFFTGLGKAIDFLTNNMELMLPIGIGALSMFGGLLSKVPVFGQILGPVSNAVKGLTDSFSGLSLPLKILIGILGAGVFEALRKGELSEPLSKIVKSLGRIAEALTPVIKQLLEIASKIGEKVVVSAISAIADILGVLADVLNSIPTEVLTGLVTAILGFMAIKKVEEPLGGFITKMSQIKSVITSIMHGGASGEGNSIIGQFKKIFGKNSDLGEIKETLNQTSGIAQSTQEAAQRLSGKSENVQSIREHLKNIALIAVDIALLGVALGIAYKMMPDDLVGLLSKLGVMALAVVEIGALAKLAEKVKISNKALGTLALIAADLGALGLALGIADRLIVSDFGTLTLKLVAMGLAVIEMGALALLAENVKVSAKGMIAIIGLAADIAAVGLALGIADRAIQSDFGTLMAKLGAMGLALIEFGVLAGIIGALMATGIGALIAGAGIAAILGFAAAMAAVALAIGEVDKNVPSNIKDIKVKIENIGECLEIMASQSFGNPLKNFVNMIDSAILTLTAQIYIDAARALNEISKIKLNRTQIRAKVELITECLQIVSNDRGNVSVLQMFKTSISQFLGMVDVAQLSKVIDIYLNIAKTLSELQDIKLNKRNIADKVMFIRETIEFVSSTSEGSVGMAIAKTVEDFLNAVDMKSVEEVVSIYTSIAWKLNEIQQIDINAENIGQKVEFIKKTIDSVTMTKEGSIFDALDKAIKDELLVRSTENASKILQIFSNLTGTLNSLKDVSIDDNAQATINKNIEIIQGVIAKVLGQNGDGGLAGFLRDALYGGSITSEDVEKAKDILDNFVKLSESVKEVSKVELAENWTDGFDNMKKVLDKINEIKPITSIKYKVETIEGTKTIFNAMRDMSNELENLKDVGDSEGDNFKKITNVRDLIAQIGMVWEAPDIENKTIVVHTSQSILNAMREIADEAINLPDISNGEAQNKVIAIRDLVAQVGMVWQADDIENKENVVNISKSILQTFKDFGPILEGFPEITDDQKRLVSVAKSVVEDISTISGEGFEDKLEIVKSTKSIIDELVGISNSMASLNAEGINNGLLGQLVTILNTEIANIVNTLESSYGSFYDVGQNFADYIVSGFSDIQLEMLIFNQISSMIEQLSSHTESFKNLGRDYAIGFIERFKQENFRGAGSEAGQNVAIGFAEGMSSEMRRINYAVSVLSTTAINKLKQLLGIASPSKVAIELGVYFGEGLVEGILSTEDQLKDAMKTISNDIQNPLDDISSNSLELAGLGSGNGGVYGNRTNNLTLNNQIYTQFDIDQMGRDIMWNMERY